MELTRTQEILLRHLPQTGVILDIGGGPGVYSLWLAKQGYTVHLVDMIPLHIEQARRASEAQGDYQIGLQAGDARKLEFESNVADSVLLFGPLYHLTDREDRIKALNETYRVTRPGGMIFIATISRFALMIDSFKSNFIANKELYDATVQTIRTGTHQNPTGDADFFTDAYFHHPHEIRDEVEEVGFEHKTTISVEGPFWMFSNFHERWDDPVVRERILNYIRMIESEETVIGTSMHLMTVCQKPM